MILSQEIVSPGEPTRHGIMVRSGQNRKEKAWATNCCSLPISCDFGSDLELMRKNVELVSKKHDFLELKLSLGQSAVQSSSVQFSVHLNCNKVQQFRATRVE